MTAMRILLLAAGILVIGLVLGLVFALRGEHAPAGSLLPPTDTPGPPASPSAAPTAPRVTVPRPLPKPPTTTPAVPESHGSRPDPSANVRDHRGEGPSAAPSGLLPDTMIAARHDLGPAVQACAAGVATPAEGKVRFFVHSTFHVAGGRVTASGAEIDGAEAMGPEFATCVRRAFESLAAAAPPNQPDGEELVHMPFAAP